MSGRQIKIFSGNAHPELAKGICKYLNRDVAKSSCRTFKNGEIGVKVGESVRDCDVYIVQPTCSSGTLSCNDALMELLIMADAMRRGSAHKITAVLPVYGYARQDKKDKARAPISAKLVANLLIAGGFTRIITMDLHASQIQGFFDIPVDNLFGEILFVNKIKKKFGEMGIHDENAEKNKELVIVSPDAGGVKRAKSVADHLNCGLCIIHKERKRANEVSNMTLVGNVQGKVAFLVDDIADTLGTLCLAAETLEANGAKEVYALVIHGVLSGPAIDRLNKSVIKQCWCTNTIPQAEKLKLTKKLKVIDVAKLFGESIRRIQHGESVSQLFQMNIF